MAAQTNRCLPSLAWESRSDRSQAPTGGLTTDVPRARGVAPPSDRRSVRRSGDHSRLGAIPCPPLFQRVSSTSVPPTTRPVSTRVPVATCCLVTSVSSPLPAAGSTSTCAVSASSPRSPCAAARPGQSPTPRRTRSPRRPSRASTPASPRRRCCRSSGSRHGARPTYFGRDARLVLVADGIEYAGNLGTLVRTADAAGADGLVLTSRRLPADPPEGLRGQSRHGAVAAGAVLRRLWARPAATWPPPASRRTSPTRPPRRRTWTSTTRTRRWRSSSAPRVTASPPSGAPAT